MKEEKRKNLLFSSRFLALSTQASRLQPYFSIFQSLRLSLASSRTFEYLFRLDQLLPPRTTSLFCFHFPLSLVLSVPSNVVLLIWVFSITSLPPPFFTCFHFPPFHCPQFSITIVILYRFNQVSAPLFSFHFFFSHHRIFVLSLFVNSTDKYCFVLFV